MRIGTTQFVIQHCPDGHLYPVDAEDHIFLDFNREGRPFFQFKCQHCPGTRIWRVTFHGEIDHTVG
jgi:hypothetical protein